LSGAAKGRLLYQRRLSVIFSRCARVQGSHGGLTPPALVLVYERLSAKKRFLRCTNARRKRAAGVSPPWAWVTRLQYRYSTRSGTLVSCGDRSGGREPAVGVGNSIAQIQACLFRGPPTVCGGIAVALALIVTTGGLRPPLLCWCTNACRRKNDFCDAQTHVRPGAVGVSPPWVFGKRACNTDTAHGRKHSSRAET
jgi:hypothetical protein